MLQTTPGPLSEIVCSSNTLGFLLANQSSDKAAMFLTVVVKAGRVCSSDPEELLSFEVKDVDEIVVFSAPPEFKLNLNLASFVKSYKLKRPFKVYTFND